MNRFMTKDLMVSVLPGGELGMACGGESVEDEERCGGESVEEVRCGGESVEEDERCGGESTEEVRCGGESTEDHYAGADWRGQEYDLLHRELETALKG